MVKFSCSGFEDCLWHPCQLHWYSHRCASYRKRDFWKLYLWSSTSGPYLSFDHLDGLDGGFFILLKLCSSLHVQCYDVTMFMTAWFCIFPSFFVDLMINISWSLQQPCGACRMFAPTQHCAASPCPAWSSRRGAAVLVFLVNGLAKISSQLNLYQVFFPATSGRVKSSEFSVKKSTNFPRFFTENQWVEELVDGSPYCTFKMSADVIGAVGDAMSSTFESLGGFGFRILHWNSIWSWKLKTMGFVHIMYSWVSSWRSSN